ncbi:MAG: aminodeoxychorismate synthase component I [Candidatus Omnitrophica bacterium]|nr:aminodeoxychorismate synthase component I [Candidatus Omnitrophota bacterium]
MINSLPKIKPVPIIEKIKISSPVENIFSLFANDVNVSFLNSSMKTDAGRFSFIGLDPFIHTNNIHLAKTHIRSKDLNVIVDESPFKALSGILRSYKVENPTQFPFIAGGIGYFSYDLKDWTEKLPNTAKNDLDLPDMCFTFYQTLLIYDKTDPETLYISVLDIDHPEYKDPKTIIISLKKIITDTIRDKTGSIKKNSEFDLRSTFSKKDYMNAVDKILKYIHSGDIYQVCLAQRFTTNWQGSPYELYLKLNKINPSPFSAYLNYANYQIISSSPERFLHASKDILETRPMKGTRPRGKNKIEDEDLKTELEKSAKDKAELLMIVDLERNDLGRTSIPGSVEVIEPRRIETYPTVFQAISVIKSKLSEKYDHIDALTSAFPGGSITGCPKIRAMEIIDELEPVKRGIYTGAIGYISFHDTLDLNIAIRTMIKKNKNVYFHVGGGIVSDSDPEKEYEETLHKAYALIQSLL